MNSLNEVKLISPTELCKVLAVTKPTLARWRKQGLPCFKGQRTVRYDLNEVLKWLKKDGTADKSI